MSIWAQAEKDTIIKVDNEEFTLPAVIVRNGNNIPQLLKRIQSDTTFYKAFKSLHIVGYTSNNSIKMLDKKSNVKASYSSITTQKRENGCRSMTVADLQTTGDMLDKNGNFNYTTCKMFASLFFTNGKVCGETNIVGNQNFEVSGKKGIEKHKEQLKMLFFNPGKKIPGIPFIGNKLDLYDQDAHKNYNYRLDTVQFFGHDTYRFSITPKPDAKNIVVDNMTTWFDTQTMEVVGRKYTMSYHAGVYDFDVDMDVRLENENGILLPIVMHYKGNWSVILKGREIGEFKASLSHFHVK